MTRNKAIDDLTKQAMGQLYFQHQDRISRIVCGELPIANLPYAVKHAATLISPWVGDDDEYWADMETVAKAFAESERPPNRPPKEWSTEKFLEQNAAIHGNASRGMFKQWKLEIVDEPL